jgi:hypothetical protein
LEYWKAKGPKPKAKGKALSRQTLPGQSTMFLGQIASLDRFRLVIRMRGAESGIAEKFGRGSMCV